MKRALILLAFIIIPASLFAKPGDRINGTPVSFQTADGVIITGNYYPASGQRMKTFILLHGLGSSNDEWQSLEVRLVKSGYGFLAYDARGHGKSTFTRDGNTISYETMKAEQWAKMVKDVEMAVGFLRFQKNVPEKNIGLIGASMGANISLLYAATHEAVPVVVLLSPGMNYVVFNIASSIASFQKRPIAIAASPGDNYAYQSSQLLFNQIQSNPKAVLLSAEKGHGVAMFGGKDKLEKNLMQWLSKY